jgi:hypothetical protein
MHKTSKGILVIEVVVAKREGYLNKSAGQQFGGKKLGWNQGVSTFSVTLPYRKDTNIVYFERDIVFMTVLSRNWICVVPDVMLTIWIKMEWKT